MRTTTRELIRAFRDFEEVCAGRKDCHLDLSKTARGSAVRRELAKQFRHMRQVNGRVVVPEIIRAVASQANWVIPSSEIHKSWM
jgi:hypothetical protein